MLARRVGPEHIREYQAQLFSKRKLAFNTVTQRLAALRFFFVKTLHKPGSADETPYPKKVLGLPAILSQEEVASSPCLNQAFCDCRKRLVAAI